jgi:hypothetical protein
MLVQGHALGCLRVPFQPAPCERAFRHDGQALPPGPVQGRLDQRPADPVPLQLVRRPGVQQDEPLPAAVVRQHGQMAILRVLETAVARVVSDDGSIAHTFIVTPSAR